MYLNVNMTQPQPQPQSQSQPQQQHVSNMTQQQQQQQQQQQGSTTLLSVIACAAGGPANGELTPRTPEIVNSLIAMTNPFDSGFGNSAAVNSRSSSAGAGATARDLGNGHGELFAGRTRARADSTSSGEQTSPPSIQHTCSQLIKEGLKLTLQTKRRVSGMSAEDSKKQRTKRPGPGSAGGRPREDNSADDEEDDEFSNTKAMHGQLTPEDEERRRRRRERNKIAATKCRLKKREKTVILVQESESLESQNHELKSQIQELETQRRRLVDMLNLHGPTCLKSEPGVVPPASAAATDGPYHQQQHQHQHHHQHQQQQQYGQDPLPSCFQENYIPADLNPADGSPDLMPTTAGDPDFPPVKLEGFPVGQDYFRAAPPGPTSAGTV